MTGISIKAIAACLMMMAATAGSYAQQKDWVNFGRYAAADSMLAVSGQKPPKAVFIGDSITDGWDGKDEAFFTDNNFVCRGISGQTSSQILLRFRQDAVDLRPEYVVILAGTNDLALNDYHLSPENVLDNLKSMCDIARANRIRPVLCSVTPASGFWWRKSVTGVEDKIRSLNDMIRAYAKSERIPYVDYHQALVDTDGGIRDGYSDDGVHPNEACYKVMEEIVLEYIR